MAKEKKTEELSIRNVDLKIFNDCLGMIDNTENLNVLDIVKILKLKKEVKGLLEEFGELQAQVFKDFKVDIQSEESLNSLEASKAFEKLEPIQQKEVILENKNFMAVEDVIQCTKGAKMEVVSILVEYLAKDA